jgi:hypothetical protein
MELTAPKNVTPPLASVSSAPPRTFPAPASKTPRHSCAPPHQRLRRPRDHDLAAAVAAFGTEVDDPRS